MLGANGANQPASTVTLYEEPNLASSFRQKICRGESGKTCADDVNGLHAVITIRAIAKRCAPQAAVAADGNRRTCRRCGETACHAQSMPAYRSEISRVHRPKVKPGKSLYNRGAPAARRLTN